MSVLVVSSTLYLAHGGAEDEVGIWKIELHRTDEVTIHVNAAPNRSNILQWTSSLTNGTHWSNFFFAPPLPFMAHYVFVDTRNAPQRYYRLLVINP